MNTLSHPLSSSRRRFLQQLAVGGAAVWAGGHMGGLSAQTATGAAAADPLTGARKLGVALVGLGGYSRGELAPALEKAKHCRLAGVVTGDREKGQRWSRQYGFPEQAIYSYDTMQQVADNPEIDILYIVTPPGRHRDHVLQAAKTGKHVICEKPMANSVAECDEMIAACRAAKVKLSIGYRLQFEPHHLELDRLAATNNGAGFTTSSGAHSFTVNRRAWRLDKQLGGGGPLMDVGIYIIQAACRAAAAMPVAVTASEPPKKNPELFNEVEETIAFKLEFPGGRVAEGRTSYAEGGNFFRAEGPAGRLELQPAYSYRGIRGQTDKGPMEFPQVPQQTLQMDDFAQCIVTGRATPVPGEMGRQHMAIIEAIYEASRTGKRVEVRA